MPDIELNRRRLLAARAKKASESHTPVKAGSHVPQGLVQRAMTNPQALQSTDMLYLQRTIGNRALSQLMNKGSSGMKVGASGDRFEQEADRVSAQVSGQGQSRSVQRSAGHAEVGAEGGVVSRDLESRIQHARGGGSPAPEGVRRAMEEKTGADFGNVRVHDDKEANSISSQLGAKAATYGKDIFLGRNQSPHDVQLMSHELTHTIQQGAVKSPGEHTPIHNSGSKTPAIQLKGPSKFDKWVSRNKNSAKNSDHVLKRVDQLQELTDEQLKNGYIGKTVGFYALKVFQELLMLPVTVIDQLTVLDLHLKDFFNFLRSGKTRLKNEKRTAKTDKRLRKRHFKRELKRLKKEKPDGGYFGKDFKKFKSMNTTSELYKGRFKRIVGRSGLRSYLVGQKPHTYLYGKSTNVETKNILSSEYNPLKHMAWGLKDLKSERGIYQKEREQRAKQPLPPTVDEDQVVDDDVQAVNEHIDDANENVTDEKVEVNTMSEEDLELIRMIDEVQAEIDKKIGEDEPEPV